MKGKLWKETICIYAEGTIISWAVQRVTRNRLILLKKGLICHFLPEFVKSKAVGGFQNRLSTLVGFKAGSEPVSGSAHCCGAAVLGWRPSSLHGASLIQSLGTSIFEGFFFYFFIFSSSSASANGSNRVPEGRGGRGTGARRWLLFILMNYPRER